MIVNLTPHDVNLDPGPGGPMPLAFAPSGTVARVDTYAVPERHPNVPHTIPLVSIRRDGVRLAGEVSGPLDRQALVELGAGVVTAIIVSTIVAEALLDRSPEAFPACAVLVPDTGQDSAIRDAKNRIVGVRRFRLVQP